jgi:integrase
MFTLMFNTGLRIAAVTGAQFGDMGFESDGQDSYLVLHYTKKGGETDWVPLTEAVLAVLHRYWQVRGERGGVAAEDLTGFLFVTTSHPKRPDLVGGKQCTQNRTFDHLRVLARQFGLTAADTMTLHSTRRTAGTLALASGASLEQVQDLLGHADPRTTRDGYDANRHRLATSPVHTIAHALAEANQRLRRAVDENAPDPDPA